MIKKLRARFIALSMFSLLLVLALIMGSINLLNYRRVVSDADSILAILAANDGAFPKPGEPKGGALFKAMSPEAPYESRFFSVLLDGAGSVIAVDTGRIAAVDTGAAIEYAQAVFAGDQAGGFLKDYRFVRQAAGDGVRVIFLDCGRSLNTFRTFLWTSCGISLAGLAAVFLLMLLLSGRIIRPVSESYEKQKRFITDAGHELKTPLTIIEADADVLRMEIGENEWLADIGKQTERLTALTKDLIYLSRMEEDGGALQLIDFPASDVTEETAQSFQALAKARGKRFTCAVAPMLSLHGDEKAFRQLVSILLDNALKHSDAAGEISLTLDKQGRMLRLCVYNTAENVPQEGLERLFERFYRADPSRSSETGGYGIGLSIAQAIVAAHKGKITAATQDGKSLLVTALLPM